MKKTLSLILAVMMLLGCMSITAFAENTFSLKIGGVEVTTEGKLDTATFPAITAGTVTYTAAEHNNGTAKLTLDNATIIAPTGNFNGIYANNGDLVIELIGDNTVQAKNEGGNGICIFRNGTFTGNGSLTVTASTMSAIYTENLCTFSMHGPLTAISSGWAGLETSGGIFVSDGAGDIVAHGSSGSAAIIMWDGEITGYKRVLGSADAEEEDPANMLPITFAYYNQNMDKTVPKVGNSDVSALSVVMYSYPATSGTTDIKAIKAAPLSYKLVIPQNVPTITAAGVTEIGAPSVEEVKNATEKTVISYTASGTQLTLENSEKTMATSYYTDSEGTTPMPSTAIEVYKSGAVVSSLTTLYVGVAQSAWDAAENGTYKATVTFNFDTEEVDTSITYMDWDSVNKKLVEKPVPNDAIEVTNATTTLAAGEFYVVKGTDVQTNTLTVSGTTDNPTTLILMDGAKLTATGGINVASDKALVITGQKLGTGELYATGGNNSAGIGGGIMGAGGNITINGGSVTANGGMNGAGIGGGMNGAGGSVTINGGSVSANGGASGAGIGGGDYANGGEVTINGGTVTANGGDSSAGIGGGRYGAGDTVNINGGTVTATAGSDGFGRYAAAIGASIGDGSSGTVTFGEGVDFTVKAGDTAPGSETNTADYATDHSAAYVKIEKNTDPA